MPTIIVPLPSILFSLLTQTFFHKYTCMRLYRGSRPDQSKALQDIHVSVHTNNHVFVGLIIEILAISKWNGEESDLPKLCLRKFKDNRVKHQELHA